MTLTVKVHLSRKIHDMFLIDPQLLIAKVNYNDIGYLNMGQLISDQIVAPAINPATGKLFPFKQDFEVSLIPWGACICKCG